MSKENTKAIVVVCKKINSSIISYYAEEFSNIDIIVVTPDSTNLKSYKNVIFKKDNFFLNRKKFHCIEDTTRPNWYYQQFLKYCIVVNLKYDLVQIVDGDTYVRKDLIFSELIYFTKKKINQQYSKFIELQTKEFFFSKRNYITNQMCFKRKYLKKIIFDLSNNNHWIEEICKTLKLNNDLWFSEYQFYANYILKNGLANESEIKVFRRFDIINKKIIIGFKYYAVLAYENQHKKDFLRKIRARLFYAFKFNLG